MPAPSRQKPDTNHPPPQSAMAEQLRDKLRSAINGPPQKQQALVSPSVPLLAIVVLTRVQFIQPTAPWLLQPTIAPRPLQPGSPSASPTWLLQPASLGFCFWLLQPSLPLVGCPSSHNSSSLPPCHGIFCRAHLPFSASLLTALAPSASGLWLIQPAGFGLLSQRSLAS